MQDGESLLLLLNGIMLKTKVNCEFVKVWRTIPNAGFPNPPAPNDSLKANVAKRTITAFRAPFGTRVLSENAYIFSAGQQHDSERQLQNYRPPLVLIG